MKKYIFIGALILSFSLTNAQKLHTFSFAPAFGFGFHSDNESTFTGSIRGAYGIDNKTLAFDYQVFSSLLTGEYDHHTYALFGGIGNERKFVQYNGYIGFEYAYRDRGEWNDVTQQSTEVRDHGYGLAIKGDFKLVPFKYATIGIEVRAGVNTLMVPYISPAIFLEIGKLL